jgi:hypothetical protein
VKQLQEFARKGWELSLRLKLTPSFSIRGLCLSRAIKQTIRARYVNLSGGERREQAEQALSVALSGA